MYDYIEFTTESNRICRMFHSDLPKYRLGTQEQTENCYLCVIQHVSGCSETEDALMMTPFKSMEEWNEYKFKSTEIKTMLAKARELRNMSIITEEGFKTKIANVWYPLTLKFVMMYGKEMIPFDIRWEINDIEKNCFEARQTVWPRHVVYQE